MSQRFCTRCGHPNPGQARFCMECGQRLAFSATAAVVPFPAPVTMLGGASWSGPVAGVLAMLGLWHISRKARQTAVAVLLLILFFGLPVLCGFATFALEWLGRLLQ
jgi:hypothetical protein